MVVCFIAWINASANPHQRQPDRHGDGREGIGLTATLANPGIALWVSCQGNWCSGKVVPSEILAYSTRENRVVATPRQGLEDVLRDMPRTMYFGPE